MESKPKDHQIKKSKESGILKKQTLMGRIIDTVCTVRRPGIHDTPIHRGVEHRQMFLHTETGLAYCE